MSEFLSQEEIDALLGGGKKEEKQPESKIKPFDFSQVEHVKKGGIPGLEVIFEKWAKLFAEEIRKNIPQISFVSRGNIYYSRFGNFMQKIPLPASFTTFFIKPLKESSILIIDARVVFTLISVMFGGEAKAFKIEGREFTKLEISILEEFIQKIFETLELTFSEFYTVNIEKKSVDFNPLLVRSIPASEKVIVVESNIDLDGYEVPFFFVFPTSLFIPIKDIIFAENFGVEVPPEWKETILNKILKTKVRLTLQLTKKRLTVGELMQLKIGDEINLGINKDSITYLYVEDKLKFLAKFGKIDNQFAAYIIKKKED